PSRQSACDEPCSLRPHGCGLGLRGYSLSGPPRVHLRYGPRTCAHPRDEVVEGLQDLWLPSGLPSQLRGFRFLPRQVYLLLNTSAFTGRTTGRADFPHPALGQELMRSPTAGGVWSHPTGPSRAGRADTHWESVHSLESAPYASNTATGVACDARASAPRRRPGPASPDRSSLSNPVTSG